MKEIFPKPISEVWRPELTHLPKLTRARVHIRVGKIFRLSDSIGGRQDAVNLGTQKIMAALADLLPEKYRGVYSNPK